MRGSHGSGSSRRPAHSPTTTIETAAPRNDTVRRRRPTATTDGVELQGERVHVGKAAGGIGAHPATQDPTNGSGDPSARPFERLGQGDAESVLIRLHGGRLTLGDLGRNVSLRSGAGAVPTLEVVRGTRRGRHFLLSSVHPVVGREDADVVLTDSGVSRRHAQLIVAADALGIRPHTVSRHLENIYDRVGVRSKTALVSRVVAGKPL